MTSEWDAEQYHDTHRKRVEELVTSKYEGKEIVIEAAAPAPKVVDLMAALEASVKAASSTSKSSATKTAKKPTTAAETKAAAKAGSKDAEPQRRSARKKAS